MPVWRRSWETRRDHAATEHRCNFSCDGRVTATARLAPNNWLLRQRLVAHETDFALKEHQLPMPFTRPSVRLCRLGMPQHYKDIKAAVELEADPKETASTLPAHNSGPDSSWTRWSHHLPGAPRAADDDRTQRDSRTPRTRRSHAAFSQLCMERRPPPLLLHGIDASVAGQPHVLTIVIGADSMRILASQVSI